MALMEHKISRIFDANLNRGTEGLRVIEEIARFILDDKKLQNKIKDIRHRFLRLGKKTFAARPASNRIHAVANGRDSENDVGGKSVTGYEVKRENIFSIIQSNFSRAAESARVFEEFSKLESSKLPAFWKKIRFEIYTCEKELISAVIRDEMKRRLFKIGLYCVIDAEFIERRDIEEIAKEMITGGTKIIQYRDKISMDRNFLENSKKLQKICSDFNVLFIINDRVDAAYIVNADGVHLGQDDMPVSEARRILGQNKIIGKSCENRKQIIEAIKEDIDYIGLSGIFKTDTKKEQAVAGVELIKTARRIAGSVPLIAIGGINKTNIDTVLKFKPDGICMISAILKSEDIQKTTSSFRRIITKKLK